MRRSRRDRSIQPNFPEAEAEDGSSQALDQIANWVRFADAKATILTAGLGVTITMLVTNAAVISRAIKASCQAAYIVGTFSAVALIAVGYTLFWLVRAINPQSKVPYNALNRFAWPTLTAATPAQMIRHSKDVDIREDAWRQVIDLSVLAERKFQACTRAVRGFAIIVIFGIAAVAGSIGFTA